MAETKQPERPRQARANVRRIGLKTRPSSDAYHFLLVSSWPRFFGLIAAAYLTTNSIFACLYLARPGCLENAREGAFLDAFFFSIQTMATIGYGKMSPVTTYANVLVTFESLLGILAVALVTGLTFAKFARPTARVLFSNVLVVSKRDGVRSLMFRMANERQNQIVDANLHVVLTINDKTEEGEAVRRFHTLSLTRSRAATFALTWTCIHPITPDSPLFGLKMEDLVTRGAGFLVSLTGIDETFVQTVHASHDWSASDVRFDHRFTDILVQLPDGGRAVDYTKFHDTAEVAA